MNILGAASARAPQNRQNNSPNKGDHEFSQTMMLDKKGGLLSYQKLGIKLATARGEKRDRSVETQNGRLSSGRGGASSGSGSRAVTYNVSQPLMAMTERSGNKNTGGKSGKDNSHVRFQKGAKPSKSSTKNGGLTLSKKNTNNSVLSPSIAKQQASGGLVLHSKKLNKSCNQISGVKKPSNK